ncbi:hypothetical protein [Candidatus Nanopusillus massiliensis]|nr:hypothetical protein [Candidatus Nanopusillus massiliensis]
MKNILLYKPVNFSEQKKAIYLTYDYIKNNSNDVGLLVFALSYQCYID